MTHQICEVLAHLLKIIHLKYEMMIVTEQYFRNESDSCSTIFSCGPMHELCMRIHSISYCYPIVFLMMIIIYGCWWTIILRIFVSFFCSNVSLLNSLARVILTIDFFMLFISSILVACVCVTVWSDDINGVEVKNFTSNLPSEHKKDIEIFASRWAIRH